MRRRCFLVQAPLLVAGVALSHKALAAPGVCGVDKKFRAKLKAERLTSQVQYVQTGKDGSQVARCWLACLQMVFRFYGHNIAAEKIRDEAYKGKVPSKPWEDLGPLKRTFTDDKGKKFSVVTENLAVRASDAAELLADNQPLIIGAFGHPVLLTAMSYTGDRLGGMTLVDATVLDPTPGTGTRVVCSPDWVNVSFISRIAVRKSGGKT
jgi:hypothetical protein